MRLDDDLYLDENRGCVRRRRSGQLKKSLYRFVASESQSLWFVAALEIFSTAKNLKNYVFLK